MKHIPFSELWLAARNGPIQANLCQAADACWTDRAQLVLADRLSSMEDYLVLYRLADEFLDTSLYSEHTSADALMVGLPVVIYQGDAVALRVAASLLHAIGIQELVAHSLTEYEGSVIAMIADLARLADIKARLRANKAIHLFNIDMSCHNLDSAYLTLGPAEQALPLPEPAHPQV